MEISSCCVITVLSKLNNNQLFAVVHPDFLAGCSHAVFRQAKYYWVIPLLDVTLGKTIHNARAVTVFCLMLVCSTYISLLIRETHVRVPHREAVSQAREFQLLDFHLEIGLKTLHHLQNIHTFQSQLSRRQTPFRRTGWVWSAESNLPLRLQELPVHRVRERGAAVVGDGEVSQLLQVHLRVERQPGRNNRLAGQSGNCATVTQTTLTLWSTGQEPPLICQWTLIQALKPSKELEEELAGPLHTSRCAKSTSHI